jgi:hypothetical protein
MTTIPVPSRTPRYNKLKQSALEIFNRHGGWLRPPDWATLAKQRCRSCLFGNRNCDVILGELIDKRCVAERGIEWRFLKPKLNDPWTSYRQLVSPWPSLPGHSTDRF